jgi:hypothetical protein
MLKKRPANDKFNPFHSDQHAATVPPCTWQHLYILYIGCWKWQSVWTSDRQDVGNVDIARTAKYRPVQTAGIHPTYTMLEVQILTGMSKNLPVCTLVGTADVSPSLDTSALGHLTNREVLMPRSTGRTRAALSVRCRESTARGILQSFRLRQSPVLAGIRKFAVINLLRKRY